MTRRNFLFAVGILCPSFAARASHGSTITGSEYQRFGFDRHFELARKEPFRCVGAFRNGCIGSGVLIGGRFVLTTAHSVVNREALGYRDGNQYEFVMVTDAGRERTFRVRRFHVPRAYFKSVENPNYWGVLGADIAVAELDRAPQIVGVTTANLSRDTLKVGTLVTMIAHGMRGNTADGTRKDFGSGYSDKPPRALGFRATVMQLQANKHKHVLIYDGRKNIELQGIVSSSDSGGGAFVEENGVAKLVGIIATSQKPTLDGRLTEDTVQMGFTSVGPYAEILSQGMTTGDWRTFEDYDW